jgi:ligand-binding sensor domain-containing protein
MTKARALFFTFFSLVLCIGLRAQVSNTEKNSIRFIQVDEEPELRQNIIFDIVQDKEGFLWLGTYTGLYRYDGYNVRHYQGGKEGIPPGPVYRVHFDREGLLWMSMQENGVVVFDARQGKSTHYTHDPKNPESLTTNATDELFEDAEGNIWIGTHTAGVNKWDRKTKKIRRFPQGEKGLAGSWVVDAKFRGEKRWPLISTFEGIQYYDAAKDTFLFTDFTPDLLNPGPRKRIYNSIYEDTEGNIWFAGPVRVVKYDPETRKYSMVINDNDRIEKTRIMEDHEGVVWISTAGVGLYSYDLNTGKSDVFRHNAADIGSLPGNRVVCVYEDEADNLWIGTYEGLSKVRSLQRNISAYVPEALADSFEASHKHIRTVYIDPEGYKWFGTLGAGLYRLSPDGRPDYFFYDTKELPYYVINFINTIYPAGDNLLIGGQQGLIAFNKRESRFIDLYHIQEQIFQLHGVAVWAIFIDDTGTTWLGTKHHGLASIDPRTKKLRLHPEIMQVASTNFSVWRIYKASDGAIWLGTNEGLKRVVLSQGGVSVTHLPCKDAGEVFYIHEDSEKNLWLATTLGGLIKFYPKTGRFDAYTTNEGLPSNTVCSILEDGQKRLWVSTLRGICVFDRVTNTVIRSFDAGKDLFDNRFNFGSCFKTADGQMYFGGSNGVNSFYPDKLLKSMARPNVALISFKVLHKELYDSLQQNSSIVLPYNQNTISFEFACLDLTNPENNHFAYQLEGLDTGWVNTGTRNYAAFSNLDPGEYTFRIKGMNAYGIWSAPKSYSILIKPPFYRTTLFYILSTTLVLGIIGLILAVWIRQKNLQRRRVQSELSALRSQLNSHFIFNSLTSLQLFIISKQDELALEYLSQFARLMRMILENSKKDWISVQEEIEFIRLYVFMENVRLEDKVALETNADPNMDPAKTYIPSMLLQPLVENSILHGIAGQVQDGKIKVGFHLQNGHIQCSVEDNGIGMNMAAKNKGLTVSGKTSLGLSIIRERLKVHFNYKSDDVSLVVKDLKNEQGRGTRIEIRIPKDTPSINASPLLPFLT